MKHLTGLRYVYGSKEWMQANCPKHGLIGNPQRADRRGMNALLTEARGHDDVVHAVYRSEQDYLNDARETK